MKKIFAKLNSVGHRLSSWIPYRKFMTISLAVLITVSAAIAVLVPNIEGTLSAPGDLPGTQVYYDARWEEAKDKVGYLTVNTYRNHITNTDVDVTNEGPWMLDLDPATCSEPWDGIASGKQPTETKNGDVTTNPYDAIDNPYYVYTAEEFRWCLVGRYSFVLEKNIDLAGYKGMQWTTISANPTSAMIADGNKYTVYNYYIKESSVNGTSLFGIGFGPSGSNDNKIINLRVSNAYLNDVSGTRDAILVYGGDATTVSVSDCAVENSMASTIPGKSEIYLSGFSNAGLNYDNCYTRNVQLYNRGVGDGTGNAHVAGFLCGTGSHGLTVNNCFAVDGTIISNGGHSGGFYSCMAPLPMGDVLTNCFTNNTVYGNKQTGAFGGIVGAGQPVTFNNCYSSGMIEGTNTLGGFFATAVNAGSVTINMTNCYTTAMVGMNGGGTNLGGFIGSQEASGTVATYNITNCYAAGEVGSLDTDVTPGRTLYKTVGGFTGSQTTTGMNYKNCYYDKQTTAMREWATGAYQTMSGITGLLTKDTDKCGMGLTGTSPKPGLDTNNGWVLANDLYPQLGVFSDVAMIENYFTNTNWMSQTQLDNLIMAYSQASVSTVFCNTYEQNYDKTSALPKATYDTVRDLTQNVPMTPGSGTVWQKTAMSGNPAEPTVSLYGNTYNVCELLQNGDQFTAVNFAPGIQWLNVQVSFGDQVGQRNMRLVPTANLNVGASKAVAINSLYNHAEDVRMAYSTGPRMSSQVAAGQPVTDVTVGVFPDSFGSSDIRYTLQGLPLPNAYQAAFIGADNQYQDVNVGQMNMTQDHTAQYIPVNNATYIASGADGKPGGVMEVTATNINGAILGDGGEYDDKFNGLTEIEESDAGNYTLTYNWVLTDGRYLTGSKTITVQGMQIPLADELKYTGYEMEEGINGNIGMTAADSGYTGDIYQNGYVWYTPYGSSVVMKQDAITGQITGLPLTDMVNATADSSGTAPGKYCGAPVYVGGYLWFAPFQSDRLLRLDPVDGSMVGFSLANGINGNTNMTDASAVGGEKYSGIIFDGAYLWLIPANSDRLVRVDISNMGMLGYPTMTGYVIGTVGTNGITTASSGTANLKYESAAYDPVNNSIWLIPYNSDCVVKVSELSNTVTGPVFTGYELTAGTNGITNYCTGAGNMKFYGSVYMDGVVWMTPFYADRVVEINNLDGTPSFQGYDMSDGINGNVGMSTMYSDPSIAKTMLAASDGKYIWMAAYSSDRMVRIDPSNGQMTGYTMQLYKSMTDDVPYSNPADTTNFHNYYNNNNWGMTEASSSGGEDMYCGICFDGNNIWLSPYSSDRVVKISPSADEALSALITAAGAVVTAELTNYMTQVNPYTGMEPTIDKIEWLRVDKVDNDSLTYKGNTLSPYIDTRNTAADSQEGFDAAYAQVSTVDKGVVYANDYDSQISQKLSFTAPANGTYYVKAYFTDPVNYYGGDPVYNLERGTPQMVTVIKEVNVTLTGVLHVRQVIMNTPPSGINMPDTGFMQLLNVDPSDTGKVLSSLNITTTSGLEADSLPYSTYIMPITDPNEPGYVVNDIIPMYYVYMGYSITSDPSDVPQDPQPAETDTSKLILADFSNTEEIWVTVYLKPLDNSQDNESDKVVNVFQKEFGTILTDQFENPFAPSTGELISKEISVKNTAGTNSFVRVQLTPVIISSGGVLLPCDISPNSQILTADFNVYDPATGKGDWMYGGDGYWYYLGVLTPGQTANALFTTVTVVTSDTAYNNATLTIEVKCEAAGTQIDAYRSSWWGVTDDISGLSGTLQTIDAKLQAGE
ncbi:MAG: hypothetical protein LBI03_01715 [Clostridiales bacterium]|jgi:hypothetical protein|nr:hypothetical protein [Clostridiales bacterium]